MPFRIEAEGYDCKLDEYFKEEQVDGGTRASFRGRYLYKGELEVPEGFRGAVLEKQKEVDTFERVVVWERERETAMRCPTAVHIRDWIAVSSALHQTIATEETE